MTFFQQLPNHQRKPPMRVLLLLLIAAILLWVLSTMNMVEGVWATVLNAVFTGLSTIFALLQWHAQTLPENPGFPMLLTPDKTFPHEPLVRGAVNKRKGAIVVYANRKWRGTTLHLVRGLQETTEPIEAVANVIECWTTGQRQFLCYFPVVPPGHYTLIALSRQRQVQVTVCPGHLSEIDWR